MHNGLSQQQIDMLIKTAAKTSGNSPEQIKDAIDNGKLDSLLGKMNPMDTMRIKEVLSDKNATQRLLSTPQAQQLIKKLMGGK